MIIILDLLTGDLDRDLESRLEYLSRLRSDYNVRNSLSDPDNEQK
jgi:hypothetical protein